jgi:serralysin
MSLNLVLDYESSALAAPQSFRDAMQTAVNILDSLIVNNITVTILVGYGDWNNGADTGLTTSAEAGDLNGLVVSYSNLRTALASHETSGFDQTFVNSLPNTSAVNGVSNFYVPSAVAKALGLLSPTNPTIDGAVGMGTQIPSSLLVGVALHELTHAMGREPGVGPFDLFRYTSSGQHLFSFGSTAPPAYFSIDGGNTKLADFGQGSDPGDFLNSGVQGPNDPFDEFYSFNTLQNLTAVDKELLDVLGFNLTSPVATVVESAGVTHLTNVANHYYFYDSTNSGPSLKYLGGDIVAGQFGTWSPIGAEKTANGYEVAWKDASSGQYSIWNTDSNGNYVSNVTGIVPGTNATLEALEPSFQQDLNGDGQIGVPTVVAAVSLGDQILTGSGSATTPTGGPKDILTGSPGADTFVFRTSLGSNTVNNFTPSMDTLQFDHSMFADSAAMLNAQQVGSDILAAHDPLDMVILQNTLLTNLHNSDTHII